MEGALQIGDREVLAQRRLLTIAEGAVVRCYKCPERDLGLDVVRQLARDTPLCAVSSAEIVAATARRTVPTNGEKSRKILEELKKPTNALFFKNNTIHIIENNGYLSTKQVHCCAYFLFTPVHD